VALLAAFVAHEARTPHPMLPLGLFRRRNFAVGNLETLVVYAGLSVLQFFLMLFLQQVAGWDARQAGMAMVPSTLIMFTLSRYTGRLADRYGPRLFMGGGPLIAAAGLALLTRLGPHVDYVTDLLPAIVVFALGLALTVAPLTSTVLADADERNAGIASGVNNAVARVAALLGIAAIGAVVAAQFASSLDARLAGRPLSPPARAAVEAARHRTVARVAPPNVPPPERALLERATEDASVRAFHIGVGIAAALVAGGGVLGLVGIVNPRRRVCAAECAGGQIAGAPAEAVREPRPALGPTAQPAPARGP
jgi:MFS family permease